MSKRESKSNKSSAGGGGGGGGGGGRMPSFPLSPQTSSESNFSPSDIDAAMGLNTRTSGTTNARTKLFYPKLYPTLNQNFISSSLPFPENNPNPGLVGGTTTTNKEFKTLKSSVSFAKNYKKKKTKRAGDSDDDTGDKDDMEDNSSHDGENASEFDEDEENSLLSDNDEIVEDEEEELNDEDEDEEKDENEDDEEKDSDEEKDLDDEDGEEDVIQDSDDDESIDSIQRPSKGGASDDEQESENDDDSDSQTKKKKKKKTKTSRNKQILPSSSSSSSSSGSLTPGFLTNIFVEPTSKPSKKLSSTLSSSSLDAVSPPISDFSEPITIDESYVRRYHPESIPVTQEEMAFLSVILFDKDSGLIYDFNHLTLPFLTKYEKAKIIGLRAAQLNENAPPFIDIPLNELDTLKIAELELQANKLPFIIQRGFSDGTFEYWKLKDLIQIY